MKSTEFFKIKVGYTNCFLVKAENGYILIDSGLPGETDILFNFFKDREIPLDSIRYLVLTHTHYDHTGGAALIKEKTGAKIIIHKDEAENLESGYSAIPRGVNFWGKVAEKVSILARHSYDPVRADIIMEDKLDLKGMGVDGIILHTPGHTKGSISLILASGEAFVGDLCMNVKLPFVKRGMTYFAEDKNTLLRSWKKLIDGGVETIYPSHGEPFGAGCLEEVWEKFKAVWG